MALLKHVILDVLKPHQPTILELANALAVAVPACTIHIHVEEVDDKTESVTLVVDGDDIPYETVAKTIADMGASVHSIDEVDVTGDGYDGYDGPPRTPATSS